jgi:hypothetical protein
MNGIGIVVNLQDAEVASFMSHGHGMWRWHFLQDKNLPQSFKKPFFSLKPVRYRNPFFFLKPVRYQNSYKILSSW